ncbi:unnamed protein product [Schistosoma margrebowiei]|uniref:Uncharacterized protein n=1 Tax=Schistosoma margrebowiei TaxID=48269 RepID=A0A183MCA5_9TREM|nr:unnamed protein product [Schistosoma margrebowiei]
MLCRNISNPTTLLRCRNPMRNQGYPDNKSLIDCEAGHEDEQKFGYQQVSYSFHHFQTIFCRLSILQT